MIPSAITGKPVLFAARTYKTFHMHLSDEWKFLNSAKLYRNCLYINPRNSTQSAKLSNFTAICRNNREVESSIRQQGRVPTNQTTIRYFKVQSLNSCKTPNKNTESTINQALSSDVRPAQGAVTVGQKVKQAGSDITYFGIVAFGIMVAGSLVWYIANELMFGFSSNAVYDKAWKIVSQDPRVQESVGEEMKCFGEETSRGRRRHITFQEYTVEGVNHMRILFYVKGTNQKGTVHAEAKETGRGKFEFRYIFVELPGQAYSKYIPENIVVQDNR